MKNWFILILLLLFNFDVVAEQGCLLNGKMYHGTFTFEGPFGLFPKRFYNSTSFYSNVSTTCPANSSSFYAIYTSKVGNGLGGDINCGVGPYSTGNYNAATGVVYNFNYVQCPVDEYVLIFALIVAGLGVFFIKKPVICIIM